MDLRRPHDARPIPRRLTALALAAVAAVGAAPARAQTAAEKAAAEALFDEGKKLVDAGKAAEACPKFEESQRLDAGLGTMLYLADCYERAGRTASAWATFREAAATARAAGQADREQIARGRAEALEPKLHRHALRVEDASDGLVLERVDASGRREPLARATWGVALPIDPGSYRIEASAPGRAPWSTTIDVPAAAGTSTTVVPALAAAAPAPAAPPPPAPEASPPPPSTSDAAGDPGSTQRALGLTVGVVGLGSLALTGVFTAIALSSDGDADDLCGEGPTCADPEGVAASEDAVAMGNVATVTLIAGGALVAAGAIIYLTAPSAPATPAVGASSPRGRFVAIAPSAPGADAGLSLGGRF